MQPHSLRAPATDGGLLAEPALELAGARLVENNDRLGAWDHDFQGRRAGRLRAMARAEVFARSARYLRRFGLDVPAESAGPVFATGHQPELFHPGVWIKNFALGTLARRYHGAALNLIVDDDVPKGSAIRVPTLRDGNLRVEVVPFDDWTEEAPFEDWTVRDEARFAGFGDRVRDALGGLVADPVIDAYWPLARRAAATTDRLGLRLAAARRGLEASWGLANWELPLSEVCETEAFLWFASHLLAHLPRFQEIHNGALTRYRRLYHIRSRQHPVPALARDGEWREAPFWAWRAEVPRRRPLLARQRGSVMDLRIAGEDAPLLELPLAPDRDACCAVERLRDLPAQRIRLRTRALTTTLFARWLLGDLFLHGIGGAKYDELGDEIIRQFFGIEPPSYQTLSLTLWLGLDLDLATAERLHEVERGLRELAYNPDRHLPEPATTEARLWAERKRLAIAGPVSTRRQRVARFEAIRRCNNALQGVVAGSRQRLAEERAALLAGLLWNRVATSREYAFVLHSRRRLQQAFGRVAPEAFGGD